MVAALLASSLVEASGSEGLAVVEAAGLEQQTKPNQQVKQIVQRQSKVKGQKTGFMVYLPCGALVA